MENKISKMEYLLGCNYWASNAGADMWRNFDEACIRKDLMILKENGLSYLRIFTNWRDFQPVVPMYGGRGRICEYRLEGDKFPDNPYYLDEEMLRRFDIFCDICDEIGMKIIPGLLTGWMSGRLFIPPALYGRKLFTDTVALNFEQKYIEGMVKRFRHRKTIVAWNIGNECSCLSRAETSDETEVWTALITNTIKAFDDRPIVSGIHSMGIQENGSPMPQPNWEIKVQGHHSDILVTHPYLYWAKHTQNDQSITTRSLLHATAMHSFYSDIGKKPCCVEEINTMGPMVCGEENSAGFTRVNLYSCWAHGAVGFMWWCGGALDDVHTAPYTWNTFEKELGLVDKNGNPKSALVEMRDFARWLNSTKIKLEKPLVDAVCILTKEQDHWGIAYMTYILSKQAGVNIRFCYVEDEIPESDVYLMPSITGHWVISGEKYKALREKVKNGATLYLSNDNGIISDFTEFVGVTVNDSNVMHEESEMNLEGVQIPVKREKKYYITPSTGTTVIATEKSGETVFTRTEYGKGCVYYLNYPIEKMLLSGTNVFDGNCCCVYDYIFRNTKAGHYAVCANPSVGMTQHLAGSGVYIVLINYSGKKQTLKLKIREGYVISEALKGCVDEIQPFETVILKVAKKNQAVR